MKWTIFLVWGVLGIAPRVQAQETFLEMAKAAVKKVIVAIDLKVQRLQNKTIWLQNAQKQLENTMAKVKLDEITDWVEKQRKLYDDYFEELRTVKDAVASYHRVRNVIRLHADVVREYKTAIRLFTADAHLTAAEVAHLEEVYSGILGESADQLGNLESLIEALTLQMTDGERLAVIDAVERQAQDTFDMLQQFNEENALHHMQRTKGVEEVERLRKMHSR